MPTPNPKISNFVQHASDFTKVTGHGDSIRVPKAGKPSFPYPDYLYLVYLGFDSGNNLIVRQLVDKITTTNVALETALFEDGRNNRNIEDTNFENMVWDYPCYITFVIDSKDWRFYGRNNPNHDPIVFLPNKDLSTGVPPAPPPPYDENYAFYDGVHTTVTDLSGAKFDAVRCINFCRDRAGPLQSDQDKRYYCFEIYLEAPFARPLSPIKRIIILIDPDGQNQGPPPFVPPPHSNI